VVDGGRRVNDYAQPWQLVEMALLDNSSTHSCAHCNVPMYQHHNPELYINDSGSIENPVPSLPFPYDPSYDQV